MVLITTSLQLPLFEESSSVERIGGDRCFGSCRRRQVIREPWGLEWENADLDSCLRSR